MNKLPRWILNSILSTMAVLGPLFCVTTAFDLYVEPVILVPLTFFVCLLLSSVYLWKPARWLLIPAGIGLVLLILYAASSGLVGPSVTKLVHDILSRFSSAYPNVSFAIPPEPIQYISSYTFLFGLLAVVLSIWMTWGVGTGSGIVCISGALPFLLLCVVINDTPPQVGPLIAMVSVWVIVLMTRDRRGEPAAMGAGRLLLLTMSVLLLITVVGTIYPKDDTRDQPLPEVIQNVLDHLPGPLQEALSRESSGYHPQQLGADVSETLDLTTQGTRERQDTVTLQVSSTEEGIVYLRGAARDIYTGDSWGSRGEATVSQSVYAHTSIGTAFGGSYQAAVQVRNLRDGADVAYTPYGFISCAGAEDIYNDLRVPCLQEEYISYYWPGVSTLDLTATGYDDPGYSAYVEDTCLDLPEETRDALYDLALRYGYSPDLGTLDTIAWVAEFVRTVGTYRLNVARQPTNYDFAVYFLTESQEGYCVHFATAAATMLRALGIPSRYASGYRVTIPEAGAVVDVTDQETHAWAEVYLRGLGWLPLETTPGFGSSLSLPEVQHQNQPDADLPLPSSQPSEQPAEAETESQTPSPSPEPSPEPSMVRPEEGPEGPAPSQEPGAVNQSAVGIYATRLTVLLIPLLLLLAVLVLILRHRIILDRRAKAFFQDNRNQAMIEQWAHLEQLLPWGAEIPEGMENLALKAKFSQHEITEAEIQGFTKVVLLVQRQTEQKLTRWKKLRFRWLSCLDLKS